MLPRFSISYKLSSFCCFCLGLDFFLQPARPVQLWATINLLRVGGDNIAHQSYAKCSKATMNWVFEGGERRGTLPFFMLSMIISIHSFSTTHEWYWWAHDESGAGRITRHWMGRQLSPLSLSARLLCRLHSLDPWEYEFMGSWVAADLFLSLLQYFLSIPNIVSHFVWFPIYTNLNIPDR